MMRRFVFWKRATTKASVASWRVKTWQKKMFSVRSSKFGLHRESFRIMDKAYFVGNVAICLKACVDDAEVCILEESNYESLSSFSFCAFDRLVGV